MPPGAESREQVACLVKLGGPAFADRERAAPDSGIRVGAFEEMPE
jgi:hypothetical protein